MFQKGKVKWKWYIVFEVIFRVCVNLYNEVIFTEMFSVANAVFCIKFEVHIRLT